MWRLTGCAPPRALCVVRCAWPQACAIGLGIFGALVTLFVLTIRHVSAVQANGDGSVALFGVFVSVVVVSASVCVCVCVVSGACGRSKSTAGLCQRHVAQDAVQVHRPLRTRCQAIDEVSGRPCVRSLEMRRRIPPVPAVQNRVDQPKKARQAQQSTRCIRLSDRTIESSLCVSVSSIWTAHTSFSSHSDRFDKPHL